MSSWLKQSTSVDVGIGPFLDDTDGKTAETALTITQPDVRLKKNNGNWAQKAAAQTLTHEENGWYEVTLDATDTNTLGILVVAVHESGALPVWREFLVVAANIYDSFVGGGDVLDVSVIQLLGTAWLAPAVAGTPDVNAKLHGGTAQTGRDIGASVLLSAGAGAGQLDFTAGVVKANLAQILGTALTETAGLIAAAFKQFFNVASPTGTMKQITLVDTVTTLTNAPSDSAGVTTLLSRLSAARAAFLDELDAATGGKMANEVDLIKSYLDTEIAAIKAITDLLTLPAIADAVWDEATAGHAGAGSTGKALTDAGGAGTPPTAAVIADAVWDEAIGGHLNAGSTGLKLNSAAGAGGAGAVTQPIRVRVGATPIEGASVWVTTDAAGTAIVAGTLVTTSFGIVTFLLDAGTYYAWVQKDGYNPLVGTAFVVSAGAQQELAMTAASGLGRTFAAILAELAHLCGAVEHAGVVVSSGNTTLVDNVELNGFNDDSFNLKRVYIYSGTGIGQERRITDHVGSTGTLTVPTWTANPVAGDKYIILKNGWTIADLRVAFLTAMRQRRKYYMVPKIDETVTFSVAAGVPDYRYDIPAGFAAISEIVRENNVAGLDFLTPLSQDVWAINPASTKEIIFQKAHNDVDGFIVNGLKLRIIGQAYETEPTSDSVTLTIPTGVLLLLAASIALQMNRPRDIQNSAGYAQLATIYYQRWTADHDDDEVQINPGSRLVSE